MTTIKLTDEQIQKVLDENCEAPPPVEPPVDPPVEPPVEPPTQPPPIGGTPYEQFFGQPYLGGPSDDAKKIIPPEGLFLVFTVPNTTNVYRGVWEVIQSTYSNLPTDAALNTVVGDLDTAPTQWWGVGQQLTYTINDPNGSGMIDLLPGYTYVFNVKNRNYVPNNYLHLRHQWQLMD